MIASSSSGLRRAARIATAAAVLVSLWPAVQADAAAWPVPPPKLANVDGSGSRMIPPLKPGAAPGRNESGANAPDGVAAQVPPPPRDTACGSRLAERGVRFEILPALTGDRGCGAPAALEVTSLPPGLALTPPAILNCAMSAALSSWAPVVHAAAWEHLHARLTTILTGGSYECRPRNREAGAKLSEHATANALDIVGFAFLDRESLLVAGDHYDGTPEERFLSTVRTEACGFFTTVLGPGTDEAHVDNLHLDLRRREGEFRLCQ